MCGNPENKRAGTQNIRLCDLA